MALTTNNSQLTFSTTTTTTGAYFAKPSATFSRPSLLSNSTASLELYGHQLEPASNSNRLATTTTLATTSSYARWLAQSLATRLHLFVGLVCGCILASWLVFALSVGCLRRKCSPGRLARGFKQTGWNFPTQNSHHLHHQTLDSRQSQMIGVNAFLTSKPINNNNNSSNYCASNGDSEHDMIQSSSQSSHYEDFARSNQQTMMMVLKGKQHSTLKQQQPARGLVQSGSSHTLNRRQLIKSSLSTSSGSNSSSKSQQVSARINETLLGRRPIASHYHQHQLPPSAGGPADYGNQSCLAGGETQTGGPDFSSIYGNYEIAPGCRQHQQQRHGPGSELILSSNQVPLIGDHLASQRINLDQNCYSSTRPDPNQNHFRYFSGQQVLHQTTFNPAATNNNRDEHIYDDVMSNRMVL